MLVGWSESVKDDCLNAASEYFSGRKDNSIITFGRTGRNIISRLSSRAVMGTEVISVDTSGNGVRSSISTFVSRRMFPSIRDDFEHSELMRNMATSSMKGRVVLDFISGDQRIEKLSVDEREFNLKTDDTTSKILSSASNTSSFILLSNFGEAFSQRMHISFSRLLSKKGIPHLNVIAIPKNLGHSCLEMAKSGVEELKESGSSVVTFFEELYQGDSAERFAGEFYQMVAKKVNEFSRKLAAKANLLKMQFLAS